MPAKNNYIKKTIKTFAHRGIVVVKWVLVRNPRIKGVLKRALLPHFGVAKTDNAYTVWLKRNLPDYLSIPKIKKLSDALEYRPLISIIIPTYNTDISFLRDCLDSVQGQIYDNWELCIVDDASPNKLVRDIITDYALADERIKYKFLKKNQHIAGATNEAVKLATGEFISLLDHDDILWPNALFEVVKALNKDTHIDFLYSDEDKITENRHEHLGPFFKPDWNPDFLHSVNYITHFSTIRASLLAKVGGPRKEYNGAQDWDLFLRITSATDNIHHIPHILYSWRIHDLSTAKSTDSKPYVIQAQRKAIQDDLGRRGYADAKVQQDPKNTGYWIVEYPLKDDPLISIVIPTKNQYKIVKRCIDSIYQKTTYENFEIILVDTGSTDKKVHAWYKQLKKQHQNIKIVNWSEQPFSYAKSCNEGAKHAGGEILLMLNNDTEVITPNWLQLLGGDAQRKEIGAVGCLLFFPDGYHIQHAGIGIGLGGAAANSFSMMTLQHSMSQTQHLMINTKHNMTAVTAACLAIRKNVFDEIGGFDEKFRVTYNDVDLCLRLYEKGYQNLYTPHVQLLHHESISVGLPEEVAKRDTKEFARAKAMFKRRWATYIANDPNINPNLSKDNAFYEMPPLV